MTDGSGYETVIGLEVHAQLVTESKMFCGCSTDYMDSPPNTHVCPVCLGMPGTLPVANKHAIEYVMMTALALHCDLPASTRFDRKSYFYPDLMKGYQISQYDAPIGHKGWLEIEVDGQTRRIGITRVHLEEDVAKSFHMQGYSLIDVNRSGVPLMETVSEPDMRSPEEAREYLVKLRTLLRYIGVSTGNMEEGSFRCDANISIRPVGSAKLGAKVEVKNMNSFRGVYRALKYEQERQVQVLQAGGSLKQETMGWLEAEGVTVSQRSKEYADDYRYFPEPDLPPLVLSQEWVEEIRARLPELPDARRARFIETYGVPPPDAGTLVSSRTLADFFEESAVIAGAHHGHALSNWILGDVSHLLNTANVDISDSHLRPEGLAQLLDLVQKGMLSGPSSKSVLEEMFKSGKAPAEIIKEQNLGQISGSDELLSAVRQAIADNPGAVADFKAGKEQSIMFLTGQVMRLTRGRANPGLTRDLLQRELA